MPEPSPSPGEENLETLSGRVEGMVFQNPENGFTVLRVRIGGHGGSVTIVGHATAITAGEYVRASGRWVEDRRFGRQFKAKYLRLEVPGSKDGVRKYLASGMIPGIGPGYAKKLVHAFGAEVFDVIEQTPERLRSVPGIGPRLRDRIVRSWDGKKAVREIMVFLHQHGLGSSMALRIYKHYGTNVIAAICANPYRLAREVRGIGFTTADAIAASMGISKTAMNRVRAGISHALTEASGKGHCGLSLDVLLPRAVKLLGVAAEVVEQAWGQEVAAGAVVVHETGGRRCGFLPALFRAERNIAARLHSLRDGRPPWDSIDTDKAMAWLEKRLALRLAGEQRDTVRIALSAKVLVITGGPGVGKTTLVNAILAVLRAKRVTIDLAAPTGRAAKRLAESTGMKAKTIHRLLMMDPREGRFRRNARTPLECEVLVVDEASMIDVHLMDALVSAVPDSAALVLVGDVDQLPSVGPGQVLADIIASGTIPVARLSTVFRQATVSRIVVNAHRINNGELPQLEAGQAPEDFYFVEVRAAEDGVEKICQIVKQRIPSRFGLDPVRDVQVLCPMIRGGLGTRNLNAVLQAVLNPDGLSDKSAGNFRAGDKVMQIENDYDCDVYNGDIGYVGGIDASDSRMTVEFDGRPTTYGIDERDQLLHAYAITIHKAQGSEYPAVVVALTTEHYPLLERNLVYTAVTRGRKLVVVVGQRRALAMAVKNARSRIRWSNLRAWLETDGTEPE